MQVFHFRHVSSQLCNKLMTQQQFTGTSRSGRSVLHFNSESMFMKVEKTDIPGVLVLEPERRKDKRGFFSESWNKERMAKAGADYDFVQDNHSLSHDIGTLRGLHFQAPDFAQAKLVRCGRGRLFDAVVDVRKGSPSYGAWFGIELSFDNGLQLMVPEGCLHGFVTREADTEVIYKVNNYYDKDSDGAVHWNSCGIDWGFVDETKLSPKDAAAQNFADFKSPFNWTAP